MKRTFWAFCLLFFTLTSYAASTEDADKMTPEEKARSEIWISSEYKQGHYLIYDCTKRHFVCVNDVGYERCTTIRKKSFDKRKQSLRCAPLKKFKSHKQCFDSVYKMVHSIKSKKFCLNHKI